MNGGIFLASIRDYLFAFIAVFFTLFVILEFNRNSLYLLSLTSNSWPISSVPKNINFNSFFILLLIISPLILYFLNAIELSPIPNINFEIGEGNLYQQSTSGFSQLGQYYYITLH